jgi:hypothetical protein
MEILFIYEVIRSRLNSENVCCFRTLRENISRQKCSILPKGAKYLRTNGYMYVSSSLGIARQRVHDARGNQQ